MNYVLVGYGRMGTAIDARARARGHRRFAIVDPLARDHGAQAKLVDEALTGVDVAFEFTTPSQAAANVAALVSRGVPVVCGTTGWTPGRTLEEDARSRGVGVVVAPNFSVGMNLFYRVVRESARQLGGAGRHQAFVWEHHHAGKVDAPSGTAVRLAETVAEHDPRHPEVVLGPIAGALPEGAVHVAAVRGGHEPGTHVVGFDGPFDVIELRHRARGRDGFADGAVLAAEWLVDRKPVGFFGFDAVLDGLTRPGANE